MAYVHVEPEVGPADHPLFPSLVLLYTCSSRGRVRSSKPRTDVNVKRVRVRLPCSVQDVRWPRWRPVQRPQRGSVERPQRGQLGEETWGFLSDCGVEFGGVLVSY